MTVVVNDLRSRVSVVSTLGVVDFSRVSVVSTLGVVVKSYQEFMSIESGLV